MRIRAMHLTLAAAAAALALLAAPQLPLGRSPQAAQAAGEPVYHSADDVAWSPDGNAIAFVSNRGGPWAVWAMTPDGSGQRQLFTMEGSPDGQIGTDTYASRGWAEERISWTK